MRHMSKFITYVFLRSLQPLLVLNYLFQSTSSTYITLNIRDTGLQVINMFQNIYFLHLGEVFPFLLLMLTFRFVQMR